MLLPVDIEMSFVKGQGVGRCNKNGCLTCHHKHHLQAKKQLDFILVCQHDQWDIMHTRVMPSAECHTDHRLVCRKLMLHFKPKPGSWLPDRPTVVAGRPKPPNRSLAGNTLGSTENYHSTDIWRSPWVHHKEEQTGLMRTVRKFKNCWQRRDLLSRPT